MNEDLPSSSMPDETTADSSAQQRKLMEACTVSLFSAETFKAAIVRSLFSKISALISSCISELDDHQLQEVQSLLRAASWHTRYVNDLCYIIFVRLLSNLDQEECGHSIHAMDALITANPAFACVTDNNGMTLLHHLAGSFIFSYFMSRTAEFGATEDAEDTHVRFDSCVGIQELPPRQSVNPFANVLHRVISSNREALHVPNKEGNCPIHILCSEPVAGGDFLDVMLWYSPQCAGLMGTNQHMGKFPLHLIMSQANWDREIPLESPGYRCIRRLVEEYPQASFCEVTDSIVRLQLNSNRSASQEPVVRRQWSPMTLANIANSSTLGAFMTAELLRHALNHQLCLVQFSNGRRKHENLLNCQVSSRYETCKVAGKQYRSLACFSPKEIDCCVD